MKNNHCIVHKTDDKESLKILEDILMRPHHTIEVGMAECERGKSTTYQPCRNQHWPTSACPQTED